MRVEVVASVNTLAVVIYALLTAVWGSVLFLYLRHRRGSKGDPVLKLVLGVLALDALKSVLENLYFGLLWGANFGILPGVFRWLGESGPITAIKVVNLGVAIVVLIALAYSWVPATVARQKSLEDAQKRLTAELESTLALERENEERFRLAVKAGADLIWDADLRTGKIFSPPEVAAWLGYAPEQWPPTPWHVIVHEADLPQVETSIRELIISRRETYDLRHRCRRRDGSVLHVHSKGLLVRDSNGRAVRFVGAVRDVSAEVEAAHVQAQSQKLEGLGVLAGGVAHDFNNLLTIISASLELAKRQAGGSQTTAEALERAQQGVSRAAVLTRQLLDYSGKSAPGDELVDLNVAMERIGELLKVALPRQVRFERELAAKLPVVRGNESQFQQVVLQLVTNAAEAIGAREGRVRLKTEEVVRTEPEAAVVGTLPAGRAVRLTVEDNGPGMSAEVQARIFDPFFSTKGPGRGLGLSVLRGLVLARGGGLLVKSAPGTGTSFEIEFPATGAPPSSEPTPPVPLPSTTFRVLVVDDEVLLRRSAGRLLNALGYSVREAGTGREAVELIRAEPNAIDVVLMDLTMPELDGLEASKEIAKLAPHLPIVLSTGYFETDTRQTGLLTLPKPYSAQALEAVLQQALSLKPR